MEPEKETPTFLWPSTCACVRNWRSLFLKKAVDEFLERGDFLILDYALDEEKSQSAESDPCIESDVFPATLFESRPKIEKESKETPSQQERNEADSDPVSGVERDRAEELEHGFGL